MKTATTPESVANAVVWLLKAVDHVTGETLTIDSGMHLLGFQPNWAPDGAGFVNAGYSEDVELH